MNIYQNILKKIDDKINNINNQIRELEHEADDLRKKSNEKLNKQSKLHDELSQLTRAKNEYFRLFDEKNKCKDRFERLLAMLIIVGLMFALFMIAGAIDIREIIYYIVVSVFTIGLGTLPFKLILENNKKRCEIESKIAFLQENEFLKQTEERIREKNIHIDQLDKEISTIHQEINSKKKKIGELRAELKILENKKFFVSNEMLESLLALSGEDKHVEESLNKKFVESGISEKIEDIHVPDMTLQRRKKGVTDESSN